MRNPTFGEGYLLAVVNDDHVAHRGVLERTPHKNRRRHRPSVIRHGYTAGPSKLCQRCKFLAVPTFRHGSHRIYPSQSRLGGTVEYEPGYRRVIIGRLGVWHTGHGREPSGHGGRNPRGYGLLVLVPRFTQVDVHIDKPGADNASAGNVDHPGSTW